MPDNVSVPLPTLTSEPAAPAMTPLTFVDKLLPPTVSSFAPNWNKPEPASEPTLSLLSRAGPVLPEKSTKASPVLVMAAFPPVLLPKKATVAALLLMVALPAVLSLLKVMMPWLVREALAAVLVLLKFSEPLHCW